MTDNDVKILIRTQLLAGLIRRGHTAVQVLASNQPRHQGRVDGPVVYFFPVSDHRYGWQHRKQVYDSQSGDITVTETQYMESVFQVMALYPQDPSNISLPTAKDLINDAAMTVNSLTFTEAMRAGGVGVQRVTDIRNPYFQNDRDQSEASPSFDFTVSYKRVIVDAANVVDAAEFNQVSV